ncbi:hypothetical protein [Microbacterium testaceum]|uniref:hypothetical protein n=1 Tax=Microbacterium testaceum TaxID=2033 RepID=UPI0024355C00|nr:hypothetical protein [Microbacterium testaceum]
MSVDTPRTASAWRRAAAIVSAGILSTALAVGGASAAQAVPVPTPTLESSSAVATPTGALTLTAKDFAPNSALAFTLDNEPLTVSSVNGTAEVADQNGTYEGFTLLPATTTPGEHTITVTGEVDPSAVLLRALPASASTTITVVAQPSSSVTPATQPLSSYLKNGVTATFSGFAPGATVSFGISTPGTGDQAGPDAVADATGTVTLRFVPEVGTNYANEGEYLLSAFSDGGAVRAAPLTFAVTADAAAAAPAPVAGPATPVKRAATFTG